jgi:Fe-S cluster assembly iron-binding protein IscA
MTEYNGIQFLVNERDKVYFENSMIDYSKSIFGGGQFTVVSK